MKFIRLFLLCMILSIFSCTSLPMKNNPELKQTVDEIDKILKEDKNLTPVQKIVLKHAEASLKNLVELEKENKSLENKVISESKYSGIGKFMYVIFGVLGLGIIAFIVSKVTKIIP